MPNNELVKLAAAMIVKDEIGKAAMPTAAKVLLATLGIGGA